MKSTHNKMLVAARTAAREAAKDAAREAARAAAEAEQAKELERVCREIEAAHNRGELK